MINIGIVAHVDAGKTSLTENMLYLSGKIRQKGSVDQGTAQTDRLEIERQRGISIRTASVSLTWKGCRINLLDTPGHVDFMGEVERCFAALDAAILVISAVEGIQSHTEYLWQTLRELKIPCLIFINKIDRAGSQIEAILLEIQQRWQTVTCLMTEVSREGEKNCDSKVRTLSEVFTEQLIEQDDRLLELYLNGKTIKDSDYAAVFQKLAADLTLVPVYCGSMAMGLGVESLLDGIIRWLPQASVDCEDLSGIVYKVEHDAALGRVAHVRMFSGKLQNRDEIVLPREEEPRKIFQIRQFNGVKLEDSGILRAGEIGAIYGLAGIRVGDALGKLDLPLKTRIYTHPFLTVQIQTEQAAQDSLLMQALQELSAEDPLLQAEWRKESRAAQVNITGSIQLEIMQSLLQKRFHLQISISPPEVLYYETPSQTGIGYEEYTMPKPCWAVLKLRIEPGERGSGYQFSSTVSNDKLYYRYQRHVEQSLQSCLKQGCYGWPVTDLKVTLIDGEHHIEHTHALDFFVATPMAFLKGLQNCGSSLLEPILTYHFHGPSVYADKIVGDILKMRGRFRGPYIYDGQFNLEAEIPTATSMNYQLTLSRLTDGRCRMTSSFFAYEPCALEYGKTTARIGISPLEREKWILQARNAL